VTVVRQTVSRLLTLSDSS